MRGQIAKELGEPVLVVSERLKHLTRIASDASRGRRATLILRCTKARLYYPPDSCPARAQLADLPMLSLAG